MPDDVQNLVLKVKSSDVREEILRDLFHRQERVRPSKILEQIEPRMATSSGNFYMNLGELHDLGLVEKLEGNSRATLYSLTELGRQVAEELQDEWESRDDPGQAPEARSGDGASSASKSSARPPDQADDAPVDPDFVNDLARWLVNRDEGPDDVIRAAQELKQG